MKNTDIFVKYFVICEYASVDTANRINLIGIYDRLSGKSLPITQKRMFIVAGLRTDETDLDKVTIDIINSEQPKEAPIYSSDILINKPDNRNYTISIDVSNTTFTKPGKYEARLTFKSKVLTSAKLVVELIE